MDFVGLSQSKLNIEDISSRVSSVGCNVVLLFVGINTEDYSTQKCASIKYDTDIKYAENILKAICVEVREQWNVQNIAIFHRLGSVPLQEPNLVISVSSPDVSECMYAFQYVISKVKDISLIIKKNVVEVDKNCVTEECVENSIIDQPSLNTNHQPVSDIVPSHLIQIKADTKEINRRIHCFIERKREQVNIGNIQDFCQCTKSSAEETSCARIDAVLVRRKDSKSHLRVRRVFNTWGPQTRSVDSFNQDCLCSDGEHNIKQNQDFKMNNSKPSSLKKLTGLTGIEERLENAEDLLQIYAPIPKDIYARLKHIEDRILYLETLSPEYFQFFENMSHRIFSSGNHRAVEKKRYSQMDLNKKLEELEFKLLSKVE